MSAMKYRPLTQNGLLVSEIGFGAWGIGGAAGGHPAYGSTDDTQSIKALQVAFDAGITFYDTSDLYGMGHSETLIGKAFQHKREKVVIATKGGMKTAAGVQDFSPGYLRKALERSLERLGTDYVDLYQLHSPSLAEFEKDELLQFLFGELLQGGKVRQVGVSARSPQEALVLVERFGIRCVQVNLNLLDWRAIDSGLLRRCKDLGAGVIARTPLCFGFLTGQYLLDDISDPNDHRSRWPHERLLRWIDAAQKFGNAITSGGEQTAGQKALRFCLSFPEVATVIPGMLTPDQVVENIQASRLGLLAPIELKAVEHIYREHYC